MKTDILQVLMAGLGSFGFAILLGVRQKRLIWAFAGGAATWVVYLTVLSSGASSFVANLAAAVFANAYAEAAAHLFKAPSTVFRITAIIPLVPGSGLYYTMSFLVAGNHDAALAYGTQTASIAGAIAFGSLVVTTFLPLARVKHGRSQP